MSKQFDLRQLRYFVVVAEELNFRRAAERLFISQPPLSRQIGELEKILGVRLLERDTTSVKLTPAGTIALKRAKKLLADADGFAAAIEQARAKSVRTLRIAASIAIPVSKQKALQNAWKAVLGTDAIDVEFGESKKLQPRVRQHQFDFALLGGPGDFRGLESEVIQTLPLVVTMAQHHPAAKKRVVSMRDMQGTPLFWFPRTYNPAYYSHCARAFEQIGFTPDYIYVAPGQLTTMERIALGDGFSLLTTAQIEMKIDGVVHRPLKEGAMLGVSLIAAWPDDAGDREKSRQAKRFVAAARQVLARN
jgi:LysR family transcriptional regulator, benzoate and cis,cis-muconate-responsive activator of ben and cat genes